jgi:hypothetical protein
VIGISTLSDLFPFFDMMVTYLGVKLKNKKESKGGKGMSAQNSVENRKMHTQLPALTK